MDNFQIHKLSNFLQSNLKNAVNLLVLSSIASAQEDNTTNEPTSFTCLPGQIFTGDACQVCDAGFYCDNNVSLPCPEGAFCQPGSYEPTQCPEGYFCPGKSWRPFDCPRGSFCENGVRKPCEPGFYNILTKQSECLVCDGGKFCENAALEPKDCPAGSYCLPMSTIPTLCPIGYWCPEKTFRPIDCPRDGICDEVGQGEPKFETSTAQWAKVRRKLFFCNFFYIGSPLCKFLTNAFFWQLLVILSQKYPEIHYLSTANRDENSDAQCFPLTLNPETRAKVAEHEFNAIFKVF